MASELPEKIQNQIQRAGLPVGGTIPFSPKLGKNRAGEDIIQKRRVRCGPKQGKKGFLDENGRIWIRDHAHTGVPEHWDVQLDEGQQYIRVDNDGNQLP